LDHERGIFDQLRERHANASAGIAPQHDIPAGSSSRLAPNDRYRRAHDEAKRGQAVEPRSDCATSGRLG
jgi:hypothetical protein